LRNAAGVYHNTAAVIDADGSLLGIYRKMHIPDDPLYYEKFYFTPGDLAFAPGRPATARSASAFAGTNGIPKPPADRLARRGNFVLSHRHRLASVGKGAKYGVNQHGAWEIIQRSHAVANGCFVAAVNRVGLGKAGAGGRALNFGAKVLSPAPPGKSWPAPAWTRRKR
jgi:N-carbamoylputrescine amidase